MYTAKQIELAVKGYLRKGYEGAVVRSADTVYVPARRCPEVMKIVPWKDAEFKIAALRPSKTGAMVVATCMTRQGRLFKARIVTTSPQAARSINAKTVLGKLATVRFRGLTSGGVPRFAFVKGVRGFDKLFL